MIKKIGVIFLILIVVYFVYSFSNIFISRRFEASNSELIRAAEQAVCKSRGGNWGILPGPGGGGPLECIIPANDAGKQCTDGSQCFSKLCANGICAKYKGEAGCYNMIQNGKSTPICQD